MPRARPRNREEKRAFFESLNVVREVVVQCEQGSDRQIECTTLCSYQSDGRRQSGSRSGLCCDAAEAARLPSARSGRRGSRQTSRASWRSDHDSNRVHGEAAPAPCRDRIRERTQTSAVCAASYVGCLCVVRRDIAASPRDCLACVVLPLLRTGAADGAGRRSWLPRGNRTIHLPAIRKASRTN